jgi:hypothetical protein
MKDKPEVWAQIREANALYKAERWRWRKELYRSDLPASALRVGLALVDQWGRNEEIFPSFETIAKETGMKQRAVICGVEALHRAGLIATHKAGIRDSLRYMLTSRTYVNASVHSDVNALDRSSANAEGNLRREPDESNLTRCVPCGPPPLSPAVTNHSIPSESHEAATVVGARSR